MPLPMEEVRRTETRRPEKLPEGLDLLVHRAHGAWKGRRRFQRELWETAGRIETAAEALRELHELELRELLRAGRAKVRRRGRDWIKVFEEVLPAVVETAHREIGLRPYRVQIMGALGIAHGRLVEMATGEGKTLTISLAAVPLGWLGLPCHVITANDYLAERDANELAPLYRACGLRAGHISAPMSQEDRRSNYLAGVVYTTSKELVADFLRDRLALGPLTDPGRRTVARFLKLPQGTHPLVQRGLYSAIVDEADNQMIDEAVTPLIISREQENADLLHASRLADRLAASLLVGEDYEINVQFKEVKLLDLAHAKVAAWCREHGEGVFSHPAWMETLVTQALHARHFFLRDKQYVVVDGQVIIVDEFTGRLMPGRTWRLGLHQAVQAKEGVSVTNPAESLARLSFQRFFRLFRLLSGITGTGAEASDEFWRMYELPLVVIPPNRPCVRAEWREEFFITAGEKWKAIVAEIARLHAEGRPILVGTRSVSASEHLGNLLTARGFTFSILNAVRHKEEAAIVGLAGEPNSITIATNMAGRGTDIRLGAGVAGRGGLHVILTELHESGRIDRQLRGRSGRQGDPGSTHTFASFEDELVERFLPPTVQRIVLAVARRNPPGARQTAAWALHYAQKRAQKQAYVQRRMVAAQDQQLAETLIAGENVDQV